MFWPLNLHNTKVVSNVHDQHVNNECYSVNNGYLKNERPTQIEVITISKETSLFGF